MTPPPPDSCAAPSAAVARGRTLSALGHHPARSLAGWLWRELRVGVPICVLTAGFIALVRQQSFAPMLVYSLCIGLSIQFAIEIGRHVLGAWLHARRPDAVTTGPQWPGWPWMAPWIVISALGGYYLGTLLADALTGTVRTEGVFGGSLRALTTILVICLAVSVAAVYFFHSRARLAIVREQAQQSQRAAAEAQLRLLQSQLEPHMLFNTLANLRVLIGSDPVRAQAMLDRLIAFLRATLAASRRVSHPLSDEFDRVDDYLALMAVRMGARLQFALDLPDALRDLPVPSLLLQPLVENSIRHGLEPKIGGGRIEVAARRQSGELVLTVRDTGIGPNPAGDSAAAGFGLQQVRERLATTYGRGASLALASAGDDQGGMLATVRLPIAPA